jgi:hypothetical protein
LVGDKPASGRFVVAGLSTWCVLIGMAIVLAEGKRDA